MENCEILKKSVLKKPDLSDIKKGKRVTFCSTVKVFIDEVHSCQNNDIVDLPLNCIEVSIIDKSSEDSVDVSKNDDCNATDFLVHKVVYENSSEHEDDIDTDVLSEDADESPLLFETNAEDEGLHFVVHKVTEHEDDLIQQELNLEDNDTSGNFCEDMGCDSDIIGRLSKLSLENILAHDKIIAFIDQNTLGLSSLLKSHMNGTECISSHTEGSAKDLEKTTVSPCLKNSELVLSPPLQELGLDKIVKAQTDNILCEFDISPLNSILETDSDSDVSSEGTMIMMTSEESEKNEQHIKESLQKYESLKKEKVKNTNDLPDSKENTSKICQKLSDQCYDASSNNANEGDLIGTQAHAIYYSSGSLKQIKSVNVDSENNSKPIKQPNSSKTSGAYMPPCKDLNDLLVNEAKIAEASLTLMKNSCYWDNSLKAVQIPKDVREWKIISSPEKKVTPDIGTMCSNSLEESVTNLHRRPETSHKSDELESFALASKERVQRIRKRYFDKAQRRTGGSPVRGIRPRFGSTAEILQIVQKQNQHSLVSHNRSHVSWPCNSAITNSHIQRRRHSNEVFHCQSLPCEYSSRSSSFPCVSDDSNCDHDSVSSCPSIFFHERGVPEGASPPQSLSEDSIESCTDNSNSSIVYFSMKV